MDVAHYRGKREDGLFIGLIFAIPHIRTLMNNRGEFAMQFSSCQKRICLLALLARSRESRGDVLRPCPNRWRAI